MSDYEKAVKELERIKNYMLVQELLFPTEEKALDLAIITLKKQIPVSRNIENGKYYCPKCQTGNKASGFCTKCGQKLY